MITCINTFGIITSVHQDYEKVFDVLFNQMLEKRLSSGKTTIQHILKPDLCSFLESIVSAEKEHVILVFTLSDVFLLSLRIAYPTILFVKESVVDKLASGFQASTIEDQFVDAIPSRVDVNKKLYLGSENHASSIDILNAIKVDLVINCTKNIPNYFDNLDLYSDRFIDYIRVPINDTASEDIGKYFEQTSKIIQKALDSDLTVFVHCKAGISRSASIVIAYIMWSENMSFEAAFAKLRAVRPCIDPNIGFSALLSEYSKKL
jgi:hypothetical protein